MSSDYFNLKKVEVKGNFTLSDNQIVKAVNVPWNKNLFLIKRKNIVSDLKRLSWIKEANLVLGYPNKLIINVRERKPRAFVAFGSEKDRWHQVCEDGMILDEIFTPGKLRIIDLKDKKTVKFYPVNKINEAEKLYKAFTPEVKGQFAFFIYDSKDELSMKLMFRDRLVKVYFGSSGNFEYKVTVLSSILDVLRTNKAVPESIDLRFKEPVVKLK